MSGRIIYFPRESSWNIKSVNADIAIIPLRGQETQSSVIQYGATGGYYVSYNHTNHTNHTQPSTETREIVRDGARWQSLSGDTWFPNKKKRGGLGLAS